MMLGYPHELRFHLLYQALKVLFELPFPRLVGCGGRVNVFGVCGGTADVERTALSCLSHAWEEPFS
jgi:hypothetical protein